MTHDTPAEEEVLVSEGPVEPEGVHGGEGHGEGGQQVRHRQVYNQDSPGEKVTIFNFLIREKIFTWCC